MRRRLSSRERLAVGTALAVCASAGFIASTWGVVPLGAPADRGASDGAAGRSPATVTPTGDRRAPPSAALPPVERGDTFVVAPSRDAQGGLSLVVDDRGADVRFDETHAEVRIASFGRSGRHVRARADRGKIRDGSVEAERGAGVREWWRSLPSGVEHGVTFAERPGGAGDVEVEIEVRGDRAPDVRPASVTYRDSVGRVAGRYDALSVVDARGRMLEASFERSEGGFRIRFDDRSATYPVVVDPTYHLLRGSVDSGMFLAGTRAAQSVDIDRTDKLLVVGIPNATPMTAGAPCGVVHVYAYDGAVPSFAAELRPPTCVADARFGASVAISETGVVVVGVPGSDTPAVDAGAAFLYAETAGTWNFVKALATPRAMDDMFGTSVAISDDGTVIAAGAPGRNDTVNGIADAGSAYVFFDDGVHFATPIEVRLSGADENPSDAFGGAIALSGDGTRLLVGDWANQLGVMSAGEPAYGSAYVFTVAFSGFNLEATLAPSIAALGDAFGTSVALDATGTTAVVGAPSTPANPFFPQNEGGLFVFRRNGTTWAETNREYGTAPEPGARLGTSVAVSGDGNFVASGAPGAQANGDANGGLVLGFLGSGSSYTEVDRFYGPNMDAQFGYATAITDDARFLLVGAPGGDTANDLASGLGYLYEHGLNGTLCSDGAECDSGICTDGVCCGTTCGTDGGDCMACLALYTNVPSGTCAPVVLAPTVPVVTCRAAAGPCDIAETCATGGTCAADALLAPTTVCRASLGPCDPEETCTGASTACPADVLSSAVCRPSAGACDVAERCDGATPACPADDFVAGGIPCRASTGVCDPAEVCSGSAAACPGDVLSPNGTTCRPTAGSCDVAEYCTGLSGSCPADTFLAAGIRCGVASRACDLDDFCSGTNGLCVDAIAADGTACDDLHGCTLGDQCTSGACGGTLAASGVTCRGAVGACDVAETCDGVAVDCPRDDVLPVQTTCRAARDVCDVPEACDGTSTACPADAVSPATTTCRPAAGICDTAERCDGTGTACPPDAFEPATTTCRTAADACDEPETCTGTGASCPTNAWKPDGTICDDARTCSITSACAAGACTPTLTLDCSDSDPCTTDVCAEPTGCTHAVVPACTLDAGTDAGTGTDASTSGDAGIPPPPEAGGCSCRAGGRGDDGWPRLLAGWCALAMVVRRMTRRAGTSG